MLAAQGIISAQDLSDIQRGMAQIRAEIEAGSFQWLLDLEDVHLNIEAPGGAGGRRGQAPAPAVRATIRSLPTSACGCARKSTP